ncbi:bifunctional phosphopantothenoylcysteine decarboxylase/phosphopantothenate--cysteine ligase CoaBC [Virgibacillus soli]|uniref:bifunctional phosphopantothenoylcysteine decarboxylase/phosphopantothenate--cysteine ligase CoaBC n=1 Tax=Paracerasibacillus soli TaxID=480284 RepID=UPI0035E4A250
MLQDKKIILGVSGGIAAYKACALASKLTQEGASVKVMMTKEATHFVTPLTFQALTRQPVYTDVFDEKDPVKIAHIDVADWADMIIIAPATANIIAKLASGIADDMLTTTLLATKAPIYIAPAMNVNMYDHPAIKKQMCQLEKWGYHFIEPGAGYLACGWIGKGRLEEPETIVNILKAQQEKEKSLAGKKVLISAGPTREILDPVRFFSNRSTGKMGYALAEAANQLGAEVTLVSGPVNLQLNSDKINRIDVVSAEEMYQVMQENFATQDIVISAAAVADYRPMVTYKEKMKKGTGNLQIEMERTKDIILSLGQKKTTQFLVGFAAETSEPMKHGLEKLERKNLDAIVINNVAEVGAGFEADTNIVTYVNKAQTSVEIPLAMKREVAYKILQLIIKDIRDEAQ